MPSRSKCELYGRLGITLLLACSSSESVARTKAQEKQEISTELRIVIQSECSQWSRTGEAVISVTIENLTDGPHELQVDPALYLSSRSSSAIGDEYWAPVDLLHDSPIKIEKYALGDTGDAEVIKSEPILLRFKNKGDTISFSVDARHLLWAKTISSVWPSSDLFSTVKTDDYDLRLELETENGNVESPKVKISIDASEPPDKRQTARPEQDNREMNPPQEMETPGSIARPVFPNAPEKTRTADCFRVLKPEMSVYAVVQKCGSPDEELGSGVYIFVWRLHDGSTVSIGTSTMDRIGDIMLTEPSGKSSSLLHRK